MSEEKIGILTLFYKSSNYGGLLQSYALVRAIENLGEYKVEQICYDADKFYSVKHKLSVLGKKIMLFLKDKDLYANLKMREKACRSFANSVNHSDVVYNEKTINLSNKVYDCFIVGSDQVWGGFTNTFSLSFTEKRKIAYAVSSGGRIYSDAVKNKYKQVLPKYKAISAREKQLVTDLHEITGLNISWVLDPTLLLKREDWDKLDNGKIIEDDYLLCYFLGNDIRLRELAKTYAKERQLKIVCFPNMQGFYERADLGFGDYKIYDAGPEVFVNLIKYSKAVFTDSFHASVFSIIYEKKFYVFNRTNAKNMSTRIYSLLSLFNCEKAFLDSDELFSSEYINKIEDEIDIKSISYDAFEIMRKNSLLFLRDNI